jgi:hypothetical protein
MTRTVVIKGRVVGPSTVELAEPLPDQTSEVEVLVRVSERPPVDPDDPTGWKAIDELIGCIKGGPSDVAENHDKYLYGDPSD